MGETQEFGRWGQPVPAQEFGKYWPQAVPQDFGRWGQTVPAQDFGRGFPQVQEFGRGWPSIEQGWRSPRREVPPSSRTFLH